MVLPNLPREKSRPIDNAVGRKILWKRPSSFGYSLIEMEQLIKQIILIKFGGAPYRLAPPAAWRPEAVASPRLTYSYATDRS